MGGGRGGKRGVRISVRQTVFAEGGWVGGWVGPHRTTISLGSLNRNIYITCLDSPPSLPSCLCPCSGVVRIDVPSRYAYKVVSGTVLS